MSESIRQLFMTCFVVLIISCGSLLFTAMSSNFSSFTRNGRIFISCPVDGIFTSYIGVSILGSILYSSLSIWSCSSHYVSSSFYKVWITCNSRIISSTAPLMVSKCHSQSLKLIVSPCNWLRIY